MAAVAPEKLGPQFVAHGTHEINLVLKGDEWLRIDERRPHMSQAGEVGVLPSRTVHSSGSGVAGASFCCVHVEKDNSELLIDELCPDFFARPLHMRSSAAVRASFSRLASELEGRPDVRGDTLATDSATVSLLLSFAELVGARRAKTVTGHHQSLSRVDEVMRSDPSRPFSLSALSALAGLSPWHFVRAYRRAYGVTPHQRLIELRVALAQRLMSEPERSLTEVAYDAGFGSSSRLTEAFRRHLGVTPSAWRRQRSAFSL